MSRGVNDSVNISKRTLTIWLTVLALLFLLGSIWFWWQMVYLSPSNVFWSMINNNLATTSITKHTIQNNNQQTVDQYSRLRFGSTNAVQSLVTLTQGKSTVQSETIGTSGADFSRYLKIENANLTKGKNANTSKIIGVWSKQVKDENNNVSPQYFKQSLISVFPFAFLNYQQRQSLIKILKDKKVYEFTDKDVQDVNENGQSAYKINVSVDPAGFIGFFSEVAKFVNVNDLGLAADQYKNSPPFKVNLIVGKQSRQIIKVEYADSSQTESFSSQGLETPIQEPTNTISYVELQKRVLQLLQ